MTLRRAFVVVGGEAGLYFGDLGLIHQPFSSSSGYVSTFLHSLICSARGEGGYCYFILIMDRGGVYGGLSQY